MKHSAAKKWSTALRSGDYKQGTGSLQAGDKFCCLGVLCKAAESEGTIVRIDINDSDLFGAAFCAQPPTRDWAGLKDYEGCIHIESLDFTLLLVDLNDNFELTFDQIADVIDYFWEEL